MNTATWKPFDPSTKDEMRLGFYLVRVQDNDPSNAKGYDELMLFGHVEGEHAVAWPTETMKFPIADVSHYCFVDLPDCRCQRSDCYDCVAR